MAWLSTFLLLLAFSTVLGTIDDIGVIIENCGRNILDFDEEISGERSTDEQLQAVCSLALNYFNCVDNSLQNLGTTLEEVAELIIGNKEDIKQLQIMIKVKSLAMDVCTEGTQINKDLKADWECLKNTSMENPTDTCQSEARAAYAVFIEAANQIEEEDDFHPSIPCMNMAYIVACVASKVHEKCGQRAFNTFNTIVKRSSILPIAVCSKKQLEDLKTTFVDSLEMTENEKNLFRLTFDLRR